MGPERPDRLEASPSDLNDERKIAVLAATPNEWSILVFDGRTIGKKENVATLLNVAPSQYRRMPVSELSEDLQRKIRESQPQPKGSARLPRSARPRAGV